MDYTQDANCVGAWLFTEGSGTTVADASSQNNTGNFKGTGEPAWSSDVPSFGVSGQAANSVLFDGTDDRIVFSDIAAYNFSSTTQKFSVAFWYKRVAGSTGNVVTKYGADASTTKEWLITADNTNKIVSVTYENTSAGDFSGLRFLSDNAYDDDTWWHIVCVNDIEADNMDIYVNGTEVASTVVTGRESITDITNTASDIWLGSQEYDTASQTVNAYVTEFAIFSDALSSSEIQDIYNYGLKGLTTVDIKYLAKIDVA